MAQWVWRTFIFHLRPSAENANFMDQQQIRKQNLEARYHKRFDLLR